MNEHVGSLIWISGSVVKTRLRGELTISERVWIGDERLTGEVIAMAGDVATVQVYEDTTGLRAGAPVRRSGEPLSVTLGPGLLGSLFDGIQRPLEALRQETGAFVRRGVEVPALDPQRRWSFTPRAEEGQEVAAGQVLGVVQETELIEHRILVPPGVHGRLAELSEEAELGADDRVAVVERDDGGATPVALSQRWHVRRPRPVRRRLRANLPLITGQRVVDTFFTLAKGGSAAIPGGFGTGKTVLQHSLARWSDADIVIYIGCGERGNEMTEVLEEFPELTDPWTDRPLMERTVLIANTSNMPVSARESSIYTGITIAEYYRDQGHDVAVMADSTSRWAQALREISGRLGEMPVEEGYPAYLASRLASFYERAGRVETLAGDKASVTVIGAVSPPGGDFSEPVTRHTQRFVQAWLALDRDLAHQRHYPAIDWLGSYSLQADDTASWWSEEVDAHWRERRQRALDLLQEESGLQDLVQLVGPEALSAEQQWVLTGARLLREGFLQQNALHPVDAYAVPEKQALLLELLQNVYDEGRELLRRGVPLARIHETLDVAGLVRLRNEVANDDLDALRRRRDATLDRLGDLAGGDGARDEESAAAGDRTSAAADGARDDGEHGDREGDDRAGDGEDDQDDDSEEAIS